MFWSAGCILGRARVASRRRVLFSFFGQIFPIVSSLFLRMNRSIGVDTFYTNLGSTYTRNKVGYEQVGSSPSDLGVRGSNPGWCFFFCVTFPFFLFQCKNMVRTVFYTPGTYMCMYHYDWGVVSTINHLTRVTKSYLLALGTTQISSYFTKHWTKFLTHYESTINTILWCWLLSYQVQ